MKIAAARATMTPTGLSIFRHHFCQKFRCKLHSGWMPSMFMFKLNRLATLRTNSLMPFGHCSCSWRNRSIDCKKLTSDIMGAVSAPACLAIPAKRIVMGASISEPTTAPKPSQKPESGGQCEHSFFELSGYQAVSQSRHGLLCCAPEYPSAQLAPTTSQHSSDFGASVCPDSHLCCSPSCGRIIHPLSETSSVVSLRRKQVASSVSIDGLLPLSRRAVSFEVFVAKSEPGQAAGLAAQSWKIVGSFPLIQ